ncbi:hypothetical protein E4T38_09373 [Aureobasidium subglaciale]|nr:hypothetical protein E4T38_09373 [Aureobasidium subglaciale]KAI5213981.1 hypothetical protein E4T40_09324 [Aureobasidium subglaciale]KAI5216356.1 hypothetical protein E4T41_09325 [Aureobasidium subglaciale]KAI5254192.1 hypothetical protein E4T46_09280 [Aureobasidium subglaciale]
MSPPIFAALRKSQHRIMNKRGSADVQNTKENSRASSVETRIRIPNPRSTDLVESPASSTRQYAGHEPLVEDFHTRSMQSMSPTRSIPARLPIPLRVSSAHGDMPSSPTFSYADMDDSDDTAPPDFSRRASAGRARMIDVPRVNPLLPPTLPPHMPIFRNSHQRKARDSGSYIGTSQPNSPDRDRMSIDTEYFQNNKRHSGESMAPSFKGFSTKAPSVAPSMAPSIRTLPPLQALGPVDETDRMQPLLEDDPANFDLIAAPPEELQGSYRLDEHAEQLFSRDHLQAIFADRKTLLKFTSFLNAYRPQSIPILVFYMDALKALRAIKYANAVSSALSPVSGLDFTSTPPQAIQNDELQRKADEAFDLLVREDQPAYVTYTWISIVSTSIQRRITGTLAPHLREASEGLAEVFCLTDPSRRDNPIVFASEEFARTTQYGMGYSIGRNCRFLQGPKTNPHSIRRLAEACKTQRENSEVFVNYRRDGSPFINLLMTAPLFDSKGTLRYFIGAQVDVSGLMKEMTGMEALEKMLEYNQNQGHETNGQPHQSDEFESLSEMFNTTELETVRQCGGRIHREQIDDEREDGVQPRPRLLVRDASSEELLNQSTQPANGPSSGPGGVQRMPENGKLEGVYQHYLLIRPAPSLRILFTSPSLRVPGILQSPFLSRIGGSPRVRSELAQAFTEGRGVTAKIRWLTRIEDDGEDEGRSRWIHCTPLLGHGGAVGVWMVILVDEEGSQSKRRFRAAPPVSQIIGGKEYDPRAVKEKEEAERSRIDLIVDGERPSSGFALRPETSRQTSRRFSGQGSIGTDGSFAFR